jgi:hypothetical protein
MIQILIVFVFLAACDNTDSLPADDSRNSQNGDVTTDASSADMARDQAQDQSIDQAPSAQDPIWRSDMVAWQWKEIPGTSLSALQPDPLISGQPDADGVGVRGGLYGRIDAWNGLAADTTTSTVYSAANGGHADYAGNEVYGIDLSLDRPEWTILRQPTAAEFIQAGNYNDAKYSDYYLDGRPGSTHSYYALQFISARGAIFRFGAGSLYGTGNEGNLKTESFVLTDNDWAPAGTYPEIIDGERGGAINQTVCKDPETEDIYIGARDGVRRFSQDTATFERLTAWIQAQDSVKGAPCIVDRVRDRVVFFQDAYKPPNNGLILDLATNALTEVEFTGEAVNEVVSWRESYGFYDDELNAFILKSRVANKVIQIDPTTLEATFVATTGGEEMPDGVNGVQTRFQYLPLLRGYAYYPRHDNVMWFLAAP